MRTERRNAYDSAVGEKANTKLARRLQSLITDSQALATHLGCTIQAVNQYKQGQAFPKVENIIKIADYYDISVDYLFGNTETKSRDTSLQAVCEYTGLSEESVQFLHGTAQGSFIPRVIDFVLNDARLNDGDDKTLVKLLRFFLEYDGGNHPNRRINVHGAIMESIPKNGIRTDTIMLDEHIIENAVLEEIKNRLLKLKEGYNENGEH